MRRFKKFIIEEIALLNEHIEQLWKQFEDRITNRKFDKAPTMVRGRNVDMSNVDSWKEYLTGELDVHPKAHHPWLLSRYIADPKFTEEDFEHASYLLKKLSDLRKVGAVPENITSKNFKTYEHLDGYVSNFLGSKKYPTPDEYRAQADSKVHSENEHWQIVQVKNHQAACKFGMNSRWCTAGTSIVGKEPEELKKLEYDEQGNLKSNIPYARSNRSQSEENFRGAAESGDYGSPLNKRGLFIAIPKSEKAKRLGKFQFSIPDHGDVNYSELHPDEIGDYFEGNAGLPHYEIKDEQDRDPHFIKKETHYGDPHLSFTDHEIGVPGLSKIDAHDFPKEFIKLLEKPIQFHEQYGPHTNNLEIIADEIKDSYDARRTGREYQVPTTVDSHLRRLGKFFYENPEGESHYRFASYLGRINSGDYHEFLKKLPISHYGEYRDIIGQAKKLKPASDGSREGNYDADEYYDYITNLGSPKTKLPRSEQLDTVYDEWHPEKRSHYFEEAVKAIGTAGFFIPRGKKYGGGGGWTDKTFDKTYTEHQEALGPHYMIQFFKDMYHPDKASSHDNEWIKYTRDYLSRFAPYKPKWDDYIEQRGLADEARYAREKGNTLYHDTSQQKVIDADFNNVSDDAKQALKTHKESRFPFISTTLHHLNEDDYNSVMQMADAHLEKFK